MGGGWWVRIASLDALLLVVVSALFARCEFQKVVPLMYFPLEL